MQKPTRCLLSLGLLCLMVAGFVPTSAGSETATPQPLVDTYESLADTILGAKKTEWNLVHSILATTYSHAEATAAMAKGKLEANQNAAAEIEKLAELVAQLGNEGDAAVAAVRKRLLEGGHHHNAAGEEQGLYDEGFVIVTKKAKKALLDAARNIGKLAGTQDAGALDAEWMKVKAEFGALHQGAMP